MNNEKLAIAAAYAVDCFDQANTANAIVALGRRGEILKKAVEELRKVINSDGQRTALTEEQAR